MFNNNNDNNKSENELSEELGAVTKVLTAEPESMANNESQAIPNKKMNSLEKMMRPVSYSYGSPSMGGSPMYSMLSGYPTKNDTFISSNTNSTSPSSNTSPSSYYTSSSSKYNPPMSTTSSLYPGSSMSIGTPNTTTQSPYGSSIYSYDSMSSHSKYEPSNYGGMSYDPSIYGGYPSQSTTILTSNTSNSSSTISTTTTPISSSSLSSKYNPPNEYPNNNFNKYDPPSYYNGRSYSTPNSSTISPYSTSSYYGGDYTKSSDTTTTTTSSTTTDFSSYNFGNNLIKKAKSVNVTNQDYFNYGGNRTNSKYDIPFSTYSSFGDNFSNYYNMSPSAVTY